MCNLLTMIFSERRKKYYVHTWLVWECLAAEPSRENLIFFLFLLCLCTIHTYSRCLVETFAAGIEELQSWYFLDRFSLPTWWNQHNVKIKLRSMNNFIVQFFKNQNELNLWWSGRRKAGEKNEKSEIQKNKKSWNPSQCQCSRSPMPRCGVCRDRSRKFPISPRPIRHHSHVSPSENSHLLAHMEQLQNLFMNSKTTSIERIKRLIKK